MDLYQKDPRPIGKYDRFKSLIIGGHGSEVKLIRALSLPLQSTESLSNKTSAMILTSASLQKWVVEEGDMARQLYEADLSEMIKVRHLYVNHIKILYDILTTKFAFQNGINKLFRINTSCPANNATTFIRI